ncbi:hypothetical protein BJ138DRAFT_755324 [Hygrophoropsis aurantiaca]|uniref:Uncharacterized protein n=1 Tax=Hygrophoropsis aurantiaca TaxID=72124 RepID=A0ACB8AGZ1_9AGAM|nr:hypothetical protein BJ138DRAFT_755324 [Hygrophoropsis aurantiaca]
MADTHGLVELQTTMYFNIAALALLTFDYCITLEAEVRLVWGRKWDMTRITFLLSRYLPFAGGGMTCYAALANRTGDNCTPFGNASNAIHIIAILSAEGLLIIRTYAFWQKNWRLLVALLVFSFVCITAAVTMSLLVQIATSFGQSPLDYTGNCTLLLGLTMYKRRTNYRDSNSSLIMTLYRDGMSYMGCILCKSSTSFSQAVILTRCGQVLSAVIIILKLALPIPYSELTNTPQLVIHSVLASRILFSLRESDRSAHEETLSMNVSTFRAAVPESSTTDRH